MALLWFCEETFIIDMTACLFYLYFSIELDQTTKERNKHSHKNEETLAMFEGDDFKVENFDLFKSEFLDALRRTLSDEFYSSVLVFLSYFELGLRTE